MSRNVRIDSTTSAISRNCQGYDRAYMQGVRTMYAPHLRGGGRGQGEVFNYKRYLQRLEAEKIRRAMEQPDLVESTMKFITDLSKTTPDKPDIYSPEEEARIRQMYRTESDDEDDEDDDEDDEDKRGVEGGPQEDYAEDKRGVEGGPEEEEEEEEDKQGIEGGWAAMPPNIPGIRTRRFKRFTDRISKGETIPIIRFLMMGDTLYDGLTPHVQDILKRKVTNRINNLSPANFPTYQWRLPTKFLNHGEACTRYFIALLRVLDEIRLIGADAKDPRGIPYYQGINEYPMKNLYSETLDTLLKGDEVSLQFFCLATDQIYRTLNKWQSKFFTTVSKVLHNPLWQPNSNLYQENVDERERLIKDSTLPWQDANFQVIRRVHYQKEANRKQGKNLDDDDVNDDGNDSDGSLQSDEDGDDSRHGRRRNRRNTDDNYDDDMWPSPPYNSPPHNSPDNSAASAAPPQQVADPFAPRAQVAGDPFDFPTTNPYNQRTAAAVDANVVPERTNGEPRGVQTVEEMNRELGLDDDGERINDSFLGQVPTFNDLYGPLSPLNDTGSSSPASVPAAPADSGHSSTALRPAATQKGGRRRKRGLTSFGSREFNSILSQTDKILRREIPPRRTRRAVVPYTPPKNSIRQRERRKDKKIKVN